MPDTTIDSAAASDLTNEMTDFSVESETLTTAEQNKETTYVTDTWKEDLGYYNKIPGFKIAVDAKANWTVGAGIEAGETTLMLLNNIKGNGKDSFNSILKNMIKVKTFGKDSYAEIIRDKDRVLVNLKPLNPANIRSVQNYQGRFIRYELLDQYKKPIMKFKPEQIFHLSHQRIGSSIHGVRILDSLKWVIDAMQEAMRDWRTVLRRNVKPMRIWYLDTDDTKEIADFKKKTDAAYGNTENIYIPKGTVETEIASVAPNATLNPIAWIQMLNDMFFQAVNVPQIIVGNAKEFTDASGKIVYLAYEQSVKSEQLYIEEQILNQLNINIKLTFPATLQNELISSREKDPNLQANQPNDTTAEMEGKE